MIRRAGRTLSTEPLDISAPSKPKSTSLNLFQGGTKCTVSTCHTLMTLLHEFCPSNRGDNQLQHIHAFQLNFDTILSARGIATIPKGLSLIQTQKSPFLDEADWTAATAVGVWDQCLDLAFANLPDFPRPEPEHGVSCLTALGPPLS